MQNKEKIVVVGFGWVGQANALSLAYMGYDVSYFDPGEPPHHYEKNHVNGYAKLTRLNSVLEKDSNDTVYVVCVGDRVSEDGLQDVSFIKEALNSIKDTKGIIVLRSTVLPDEIEELRFDFYMPEFLHENKAVEESLSPYFFVVGISTKKKEPNFFAMWRAKTPRTFTGTPREAAFIKYLSNLWNAVRIAFVNEYGDIIATPEGKEEIDSIERVLNFVLRGEGYLRYGRAFSGHCLPKDMRAFTRFYGDKGKSVELLAGANRANNAHLRVQEKNTILPEWFSAWPLPHLSGFVALGELWYSVRKNIANPREFIDRRILKKDL